MTRSEMISTLLEDYKIDRERFQITWVSSAEPDRFVAAVKEMTDKVTKLGPITAAEATA